MGHLSGNFLPVCIIKIHFSGLAYLWTRLPNAQIFTIVVQFFSIGKKIFTLVAILDFRQAIKNRRNGDFSGQYSEKVLTIPDCVPE
jgi:hypothetical protein